MHNFYFTQDCIATNNVLSVTCWIEMVRIR